MATFDAAANREKPKLQLSVRPTAAPATVARRRGRVIEQTFSRTRSIEDLVDDDTRAFSRARLPWQRQDDEY
ncbi:MAG: hypothetical protein AAFY56_17475 [Pseudomonadota bacterium]